MDATKIALTITPEQWQILVDSLRGHIGSLHRRAQTYEEHDYKIAQVDTIEQKKKVQDLLDLVLKTK